MTNKKTGERPPETPMGISRRDFGKGLVASALLLKFGLGASARAEGAPKKLAGLEIRSLHFGLNIPRNRDLRRLTLHIGGRRIPLRAHTRRSLEKALADEPGLLRIPAERITHHAPRVPVSLTRAHRFFVSGVSRTRGYGMLLVGFYIPRSGRLEAAVPPSEHPVVVINGRELVVDHADGVYYSCFDTAKSIVIHHPEVAAVDPTVAATIDGFMQTAAVYTLADSIEDQGPAYEVPPTTREDCNPAAAGWAEQVPITDATGGDNYDTVYSCTTEGFVSDAVNEVLGRIRDDPTLKGVQYDFRYHGDEPESASPPAAGSGLSLQASIKGYHHNLAWSDFKVDGSDSSKFSFLLWNVNLLYYGVYVTWLDGAGEPIESFDRSNDGFDIPFNLRLFEGIDVETDERKWVRLISSPATVFGVPVTAFVPTEIALQFPPGASAARIDLMGPGSHGGPKDNDWSLAPGFALSVLVNFFVPLYFLTKSVGETENATLIDLIKANNSVAINVAQTVANLWAVAKTEGGEPESLDLAGSFASLLSSIVNTLVQKGATAFDDEIFKQWLLGEFTTDELIDSTPFVGWVIRALSIAGTLAQLAQSAGEIGTNPLVISNTITLSHTLRLAVKPDPRNSGFPAGWDTLRVVVSAGQKKLDSADFTPGQVDEMFGSDGRPIITVDVDQVPATGAAACLKVLFLRDGWAAASASLDFTNSRDAIQDLGTVVITENPVPITASTVYTHSRLLAFNETSGQYAWQSTAAIPSNYDPNPLCQGTTVCDLRNMALWVPGGVLGYSWRGATSGVGDCNAGGNAALVDRFQTVSIVRDIGTPNDVLKRMPCGFGSETLVAFDTELLTGPGAAQGDHFYLTPRFNVKDPSDPSILPVEYHLRKVVLDQSTPLDVKDDMSWGRFRISPLDRLALYDGGNTTYVVALSAQHNKLVVLQVADAPEPTAEVTHNAVLLSGRGNATNDSRLSNAVGMAISSQGAILVLQNISGAPAIKAFDFDGKPWPIFNTEVNPSSVMPLVVEPGHPITYLDMAMADSDLIWVLSYDSLGSTDVLPAPSRFRLDVYNFKGERVVRQTGVPVARIAVDTFHTLYSLNYQPLLSPAGAAVGRVEPSVSDWLPSVP